RHATCDGVKQLGTWLRRRTCIEGRSGRDSAWRGDGSETIGRIPLRPRPTRLCSLLTPAPTAQCLLRPVEHRATVSDTLSTTPAFSWEGIRAIVLHTCLCCGRERIVCVCARLYDATR